MYYTYEMHTTLRKQELRNVTNYKYIEPLQATTEEYMYTTLVFTVSTYHTTLTDDNIY